MNFNFFSQDQELLFLQLWSLQCHHVEKSLIVLIATVDERVQEAGVGVGELGAAEDVRHEVLVPQLGGYHHRVVT